MKESIHKILLQTDSPDAEFRDSIIPRRESENLGEYLTRLNKTLQIEVFADREDISEKIGQADVLIVNHPTSFDLLFVGELLGDIPFAVVTQRKRALALKKLFGDSCILPVPLGHHEFKEFMAKVKDCLSAGRKLVLFPSGGNEIKGGADSWFPLYKGLIESEILAGKTVLPLKIDLESGQKIQGLIGDKEKGREIFPEIHYTIPAEKVVIPIIAGDPFSADAQAEQHYRAAFDDLEKGTN